MFQVFSINAQSRRNQRISAAIRERLRRRIDASGGCNANICFAIDGGSSISDEAFINELYFMLDITSIIGVDEPAEFAAVQFTNRRHTISELTTDSSSFNLLVNETKQVGGQSSISSGVAFCISQLTRRRREANKIVILSDGESRMARRDIQLTNIFRRIGGEVSVVGAGELDEEALLRLVGKDRSRLFNVDSFLDVFRLHDIVEELVLKICGE